MSSTPFHPLMSAPDMQALLAPMAGKLPCGPGLRHDPVFTTIRLAREEDNPLLPMRQWMRPLKQADWPRIEQLCRDTLTQRSKDLQLSCWLLEAWTRQQGLPGLLAGLALNRALLKLYWDELHPRLDEAEGLEARQASWQWLNDAIPHLLKVQLTLVPLPGCKPDRMNLAEWEKLTLQALAGMPQTPAGAAEPPQEAALTSAQVLQKVRSQSLPWVRDQMDCLAQCAQELQLWRAWLDQQLGAQAPSFSRLAQALEVLARVYRHILDERDEPAQDAKPASAAPSPAQSVVSGGAHADDLVDPEPGPGGPWRSRQEAYQTLAALADYLARLEPHSPTPYLIRRAVQWGQLSLPEVMDEFIRKDGDLQRFRTFWLSEPTASAVPRKA